MFADAKRYRNPSPPFSVNKNLLMDFVTRWAPLGVRWRFLLRSVTRKPSPMLCLTVEYSQQTSDFRVIDPL